MLFLIRCQKFATVYPMIYCRKQFDIINYVTFCCMAACNPPIGDETAEVHKNGDNYIQIFICRGISSVKLNIQLYIRQYTSPNENVE